MQARIHFDHDIVVDPCGGDNGEAVAYCQWCGTERFEEPCIAPEDVIAPTYAGVKSAA